MNYEQLITPNPDVSCTPGWCLKYVQDAFGLSAVYPSAIASWNSSQSKHEDQNFPDGVAVPLWFSLNGNPYGHVVIRMPDGSVYSSSHPTANTPVHHASLAALDSYYGHGTMLNYLGWTEDVEGTAVVKQQTIDGDTIVITDTDNEYGRWQKLAYQIRGRSLSREEFQAAAVGKTWLQAIETLSDNPESDSATHAQEIGQTAVKDDWEGQIHSLEAQLSAEQQKGAAVAANLSDVTTRLDDANKQISDDQTTLEHNKLELVDLHKQLSTRTATADKPEPQSPTGPVVPPSPTQTPQVSKQTPLQTVVDALVSFFKGSK